MRRRLRWLVLLGSGIVVTIFSGADDVRATAAHGFAGATLAVGRFGEIAVLNQFIEHAALPGEPPSNWLSGQKTAGSSDLFVQSNVWTAGGSTGWHTHPGHSLIIVTAGEVTAYDGDDPDCKPAVYTKGMGFVDAGGDHVHLLRNEGTVEARTVAVQLIPAAAVRRIDAETPGNCPF